MSACAGEAPERIGRLSQARIPGAFKTTEDCLSEETNEFEKRETSIVGGYQYPCDKWGTLQDRLASAAVGLCSLSSKDGLPKQYQEALSSITQDLTTEPAVGNEGRIKATASRMGDQDARRVAKEILSLYANLTGSL